jgi:hypothetical protein
MWCFYYHRFFADVENNPQRSEDERRVPQELAEIIIDHLHDDPPSLCTSSLVCKSWLHPSRVHLLSNVFFDLSWSLSRMGHAGHSHTAAASLVRSSTSLQKCLDNSPYLAQYIQSLEIRNCRWSDSSSDHWENAFWYFSTVLHKFRFTTKLVLQNIYYVSLSDEARRSINVILELPTLKHLHLDNVTFWTSVDILELLSFASNLTALRISGVVCIQPSIPTSCLDHLESGQYFGNTQSPQSIMLRELYIDSPSLSPSVDWIFHPDSPFSIDDVEEFYISEGSVSPEVMSQLRETGMIAKQ